MVIIIVFVVDLGVINMAKNNKNKCWIEIHQICGDCGRKIKEIVPITFKLSLPEPCNGNFNDGKIYFWGEAI